LIEDIPDGGAVRRVVAAALRASAKPGTGAPVRRRRAFR